MDPHQKYLILLNKLACDVPPVANARLAAALVYKKEIVSLGINSRKSSPFQKKFGKNEDSIFLHAETSAIRNALRVINAEEISKSTLYVSRVKYKSQYKEFFIPGLAKPCSGCARAISTFGIKKVVYTLETGGYGVL